MKCPHCGNPITGVTMKAVSGSVLFGHQWNCVAYACPNFACQKVLSVQVDPIAIKADIVNELMKRLRGGP